MKQLVSTILVLLCLLNTQCREFSDLSLNPSAVAREQQEERSTVNVLFLGYYYRDKVEITNGDKPVFSKVLRSDDTIASAGRMNLDLKRGSTIQVRITGSDISMTRSLLLPNQRNCMIGIEAAGDGKFLIKVLNEEPRLD
ncbi:MAG: hypothetical protein V4727_11735 [Verrucomicrobiota bacterium]